MRIIVSKIFKMNFKEATNKLLATVKLEDLCDRLGIETKHSGSSVKALCQFHKDTKPSMELYDDNSEKSAFHCFSCGAHGDIFALVKEVKGMDFREAHTWLCQEFGVQVDKQSKAKKSKATHPWENILQNVYSYALTYYRNGQNEFLFDQFLDVRGYRRDFAVNAGLCLVGDSKLVKHLDDMDYPEDIHKLYVFDRFESAGLIKKIPRTERTNETLSLRLENLYVDHFKKGRVLFPLNSASGEIKGFAGRITSPLNGPKYLFTKGLDKSNLLYRSDSAFSKILKTPKSKKRVSIYLCEGLLDALRLESLGFHSVAVLGASLTESQCEQLLELSKKLENKSQELEVNLFFDNDNAGIKAAGSSIKKLVKKGGLKSFKIKFLYSPHDDAKDPDLYLKGSNGLEKNKLKEIELPFPLINLSHDLNVSITEVLDNELFKDLPYSIKMRALKKWNDLMDKEIPEIVLDEFYNDYRDYEWFRLLKSPFDHDDKKGVYNSSAFINDEVQRVKLAFAISKSSMSSSGLFPDNEAEWRRVEMCLPLFEDLVKDRFALENKNLNPIEPLNTIYVPREIGSEEFREMSMHSVEDLVCHQYVLSELLTERFDYIDDFSLNIPATRFYRKTNTTITTGEGCKSEQSSTLSFAYQIDMDVIEGVEVPRASGMFRPYFDCWKDFTKSIRNAANEMNQVNMVRLDLKRYYDKLKRYVVQDALRKCIPNDIENKYEDESFLSLLKSEENGKRAKTINWLLEQSFGYKKYNPKTGEEEKSDSYMGIPQGPDLSAFLANLVLFNVDSAAREFIEGSKDGERYTAWYARYVDDMVLIAEDSSVLSQLRIVVEDAVRKLELEVVSKEQPSAMNSGEFEIYLTQGKALASSGPAGVEELVDVEEIEFIGRIERYQALSLLNNKDLYSDDVDIIRSKLNMAMHCRELRFSDIAKVTKWIWFIAVSEEHSDIKSLVSAYQKLWVEVSSLMPKQLCPLRFPWEDPLLLAIDGLNSLISRKDVWINDSLSQSSIEKKEQSRSYLINYLNDNLLECLGGHNPENIEGWGVVKYELPRTFWQKRVSLIWHAKQYGTSDFNYDHCYSMDNNINDIDLQKSLARTYLTEFYCQNSSSFKMLEIWDDNRDEIFRKSFLLLQLIYIFVSKSESSNGDNLLSPINGVILSLVESENSSNFRLRGIYNLFISDDEHCKVDINIDKEVTIKVLYFICSITSDTKLIKFLSVRWKKLLNDAFGDFDYQLITPIPSNNEKALYGYHLDDEEAIDGLVRVTTDNDITNEDLYVSSDTDDISYTTWNEIENDGKKLRIFKCDSSTLANSRRIYTQPPSSITDVTSETLKWVSYTYKALLKCSIEGNKVPTWCNTSMSCFPPTIDTFENNDVCIIASKSASSSFPQAYIRNGGRSLRPFRIPNHNTRLWQVGVALTDILGLTRDLDDYAYVKDEELESTDSPQLRLLRNSLKKLNGSFYVSKPIVANGDNGFPKTIERTLKLLESFPNTSSNCEQYLFGFASEMETRLMKLRLDGKLNYSDNGKLLQLYGEAIKDCLARIPLSWFEYLPKTKTSDLSLPENYGAGEMFWSSMYRAFSEAIQLSNLKKEGSNLARLYEAVLVGCQVNFIESSLKAIAFESQANTPIDLREFKEIVVDESHIADLFDQDFDIEKYSLFTGADEFSIELLGQKFQKAINANASQSHFDGITPLGWFVIVLIKKGLITKARKNLDTEHRSVIGLLKKSGLPEFLSLKSVQADSDSWPLDFIVRAHELEELVTGLSALHIVDPSVIKTVDSDVFVYNTVKGEFKNQWLINKWQICVESSSPNDNKPYYEPVQSKLLSNWRESYKGDNLLYISCLGKLYGRIFKEINNSNLVGEALSTEEVALPQPEEVEKTNTELISSVEATLDSTLEKESPSAIDADLKEVKSTTTKKQEAVLADVGEEKPLDKVLNRLGRFHSNYWSDRRDTRSPSHTRVAMFQIDLKGKYGDGYHTEVEKNEVYLSKCELGEKCKEIRDLLASDTLKPEERSKLQDDLKGCKTDDECSEYHKELTKYNTAEIRRKALIKQAIESCIKLGVDLLILPEYSVQPSTILWLKGFLKNKKISVLAGTYRLPEGYSSSMLKDLTSERYSKVVSHFQSVMTLLVPLDKGRVICFNRAKKYASSAADELINPYQHEIEPLFTLESFEELLSSEFQHSTEALSLKGIHNILKNRHVSLLGFIQELICAELFLLTNPVNYQNLAAEFRNLSNMFGHKNTSDDEVAFDMVLKDIRRISLGLSGSDGGYSGRLEPHKRSIVAIPAMTTRKQDYWIFGQGAMLANGISTVFCNALCGKESTGGSCFIGLDSWTGEEKKPFITPYNGWSKGVYYGENTHTLEKEQSIAIVDIDPKMMSLGYPRPQALPVPMRLVAYLPVIEITGGDQNEVNKLSELVNELDSLKSKSHGLLNPEDIDYFVKNLEVWFTNNCPQDVAKTLNNRIKHWKTYWRTHPQVEVASLSDWLVVKTKGVLKDKV
ncbi:hypothetical protein BCU17_22090 [Vibrio splendidus]|uniref:Reverse transcriptase domain-containing protein n=1 Tax=Vibrio splendidus TaxID=29497 RepID=A0A2N7F999_VIBSP|nr:CHC2 zinc finger domain-containing protein [Vibrio splendidus]PMJ63741.1 hypothetical protein BCU17_22090 [Vibrio splendidus]